MTSKEKIENAWELVNSKHIETNDEIQLVRFAVRTARELVNRDTPIQIFDMGVDNRGIIRTFICPVCHQWLTFTEKENFCPKCGQRLNWNDEDET